MFIFFFFSYVNRKESNGTLIKRYYKKSNIFD